MQRVHTDDHSPDESMSVSDRDAVRAQRGDHPAGAAHGHKLSSLIAMAGLERA